MQVRLFIGIPLTDKILNEFKEFISYHPSPEGLKWTNLSNLHVTTCFIGNREEAEVPVTIKKIQSVAEQTTPFDLSFDQFQFFPKRRPTMIWGRFNEKEAFAMLTIQLHHSLHIENDHKNPIPHVTLARLKKRMDFELQSAQFHIPALPIHEIVLWRSVLSAVGPTYHVVERFPLGS